MAFSTTFTPSSYQLLPTQLGPNGSCNDLKMNSLIISPKQALNNKLRSTGPVARLIGPAIFEASKLKVLRIGYTDEAKHPGSQPRTYTLTHSDITAKLTLAISNTVNSAQFSGWYSKLQRDEVIAEWRKVKGKMSLHVHCHISGGNFLHDLIANLRYYIFSKELPVVLNAFVHGDLDLFMNYPELQEVPVYVYFESSNPEFHRIECWGPLVEALRGRPEHVELLSPDSSSLGSAHGFPQRCKKECSCCFPRRSLIPWPHDFLEQPQQQPQAPISRSRSSEV